MQGVDECKTTVMRFKNLHLDSSLCSPRSINLSEEQLLLLLQKVHNNLPPHLKTAEKLKITVQASFCRSAGHRVECIQIYGTHSSNPMISYQATIQNNTITLLQVDARPLHRIRKESLPPCENNDKSRKFVILLVDDDVGIIKIMSRWINAIGDLFILYEFNNGQDALDFYINTSCITPNFCDFIFMDNQMPILGGLEAAKKIREFNAEKSLQQIPIICITAAELNENDLLLAGINGLCNKPLKRDNIVGILKKYNFSLEQTLRIEDISADAFATTAPLARASSEDPHINTTLSMQESCEDGHNNSASSMQENTEDCNNNSTSVIQESSEDWHNNSPSLIQESSEDWHNNSGSLIYDSSEDSYNEDHDNQPTFRF